MPADKEAIAARRPAQRTQGLLALAATVTIWSSTFVLIKAVVEDTGPLTLTSLRFVVALAVLLLRTIARALRRRHRRAASPRFRRASGTRGVISSYRPRMPR